MSVLIIESETFTAVNTKLVNYSFHSTCDIDFCSTARRLPESKINEYVKTWSSLNEESYLIKYRENKSGVSLCEFIDFSFQREIINTYQLLKYLQCIRYNIEVCTIEEMRSLNVQEAEAVEVLSKLIEDISTVIISELPEYKAANWAQ